MVTQSLPHAGRLVEVFIPSRDRALQLDGTLRSFARYCADSANARISVLFSATTPGHQRAYQLLAREHVGVRMCEERLFSREAASLLGCSHQESSGADTQLLVVDDTIFVSAFSLESMTRALLDEPAALGFSLRLGETIRFCQPLGIESTPPKLIHVIGSGAEEIVSFSWVGLQPDWGYPLELSSSLYRRRELVELLQGIIFDSPTTLEHELWLKSGTLASAHHRLLCYRKPRAVSLALNRVQSLASNPVSGHQRHEPARLLTQFLEGWRVDIGAYDGYLPHACHEEAELILTQDPGP